MPIHFTYSPRLLPCQTDLRWIYLTDINIIALECTECQQTKVPNTAKNRSHDKLWSININGNREIVHSFATLNRFEASNECENSINFHAQCYASITLTGVQMGYNLPSGWPEEGQLVTDSAVAAADGSSPAASSSQKTDSTNHQLLEVSTDHVVQVGEPAGQHGEHRLFLLQLRALDEGPVSKGSLRRQPLGHNPELSAVTLHSDSIHPNPCEPHHLTAGASTDHERRGARLAGDPTQERGNVWIILCVLISFSQPA